MSKNPSNDSDETGLKIRSDAGLANRPNGGLRPLSEIINRSLVHIQTSKIMEMRHRIGEHELCGPDYRLVCAFAEDLRLTPEEVLSHLMMTMSFQTRWKTEIIEGRFKSLHIDKKTLPIASIPFVDGLLVEAFDFRLNGLGVNVDYAMFPNLTKLGCDHNQLETLDLSKAPNLTMLGCSENNLGNLDLSPVPNITHLFCYSNNLSELILSFVPDLTLLACNGNRLTDLDLAPTPNLKNLFCVENKLSYLEISKAPNLTFVSCRDNQLFHIELSHAANLYTLWCERNRLTELDVSQNPQLRDLRCGGNQITELDIRNLWNLETLVCDPDVRIIQRPDQNFK